MQWSEQTIERRKKKRGSEWPNTHVPTSRGSESQCAGGRPLTCSMKTGTKGDAYLRVVGEDGGPESGDIADDIVALLIMRFPQFVVLLLDNKNLD